MKFGEVQNSVTIPEKGLRGVGYAKYPFPALKKGQSVLITPEAGDKLDFKQLKKRLTEAVRQYERRVGKLADGTTKVKEFAVWIDEDAGGVYVGCRFDNSSKTPKNPEAAKSPTKKEAPQSGKVDLRPTTKSK